MSWQPRGKSVRRLNSVNDDVDSPIFVAGGTGFLGRALIGQLLARGHPVTGLVRPGRGVALPARSIAVSGDPLDEATFRHLVPPRCTYIHLVGTRKPAPWKEREFRSVDLVSLEQSVRAAVMAEASHFIYLSVAQPAPIMKAYIRVRAQCEAILLGTGLPATILRPWYVLGPGRRWPLLLMPVFRLMELLGSKTAQRLGFVRLDEMVGALVWAVDNPGSRVLEAPDIRRVAASLKSAPAGAE